MQDILNALFNSPQCKHQERILELQADIVKDWSCARTNIIQQRKWIVDWLRVNKCDIEIWSQDEYKFNGCVYSWADTGNLEEWVRGNL